MVEAREKVLGQSHVETLNSMHNLAMVYQRQDRHKEAEALYAQVAETRTRELG